jgi:hypothetical protein
VAEFHVTGSLGTFEIGVESHAGGKVPLLEWNVAFTPEKLVRLEALPRDVVVLDDDLTPTEEAGAVYLEQAGPTSGLVWFTTPRRAPVSALYFQELGALSDYCEATRAEPSDRVSAEWPELGFSLPIGGEPLRAGRKVVLSHAYLAIAEAMPAGDLDLADVSFRIWRRFIDGYQSPSGAISTGPGQPSAPPTSCRRPRSACATSSGRRTSTPMSATRRSRRRAWSSLRC